jgi:acyl carrier protein
MEINEFVKNFAFQFDDTDESEFTPDTSFRDLEEWSSLIGMGVLNDIGKKYGVKLTQADFKSVNTIQELFDLVMERKAHV